MRIGIAADHGGFGLKEDLRGRLIAAGHEVVDFGRKPVRASDDYPDFVTPLARAVASGTVSTRGCGLRQRCGCFSLCKTKFRECMALSSTITSRRGKGSRTTTWNIICLGGRVMGTMVAWGLGRDIPRGRI